MDEFAGAALFIMFPLLLFLAIILTLRWLVGEKWNEKEREQKRLKEQLDRIEKKIDQLLK
ncbi:MULTISPECIES: hypothetical protein [Alkalihalophilus]|uniref:Uncharacterized protein n=1 Tax=Alkalihalophilus pseudofirmus (strain ATCC BAA-2126 / JCM 17055 / OF4) TaxID=398511 RepID=D3FWT8_ALKPO|nr:MULTISPECIES: hypothetical protein [Alkalihalophilus]ADC50586.1 hypothetical protein BpOF4_12675 [Alkalihalophilus pseudofirmus OF4]MEC2073271.1 hypothetical protein [Alkalihalophilus marmarensis]